MATRGWSDAYSAGTKWKKSIRIALAKSNWANKPEVSTTGIFTSVNPLATCSSFIVLHQLTKLL